MTQRLPPALGWTLLASVVASAWALWWPAESLVVPANPDAAMPSDRLGTDHTVAALHPESPSTIAPAFAAGGGDAPMLSPAARDPFNPAPLPAPPAPAKALPEPVRSEPAAPPPPPPPTVPPMNHRVVGRFQSPDGQWLVFLQDGPQTVAAAAGVALASGYVVESVTPSEIRLRHPLAPEPVSLPLPASDAP